MRRNAEEKYIQPASKMIFKLLMHTRKQSVDDLWFFSIAPINGNVDYERSVTQNYDVIKQTLAELLRHYSALKFYTKFEDHFRKISKDIQKNLGFILLQQLYYKAQTLKICWKHANWRLTALSINSSAMEAVGFSTNLLILAYTLQNIVPVLEVATYLYLNHLKRREHY